MCIFTLSRAIITLGYRLEVKNEWLTEREVSCDPYNLLWIPVSHWLKFDESVLNSTDNSIRLAGSSLSPSSPLTTNEQETNEREVYCGIRSVRSCWRVVPSNWFGRKDPSLDSRVCGCFKLNACVFLPCFSYILDFISGPRILKSLMNVTLFMPV
jgi:hypothetical protein